LREGFCFLASGVVDVCGLRRERQAALAEYQESDDSQPTPLQPSELATA